MKKIRKLLYFGIACFFLLGSFVMIKIDIVGSIFYLLISVMFFWFGRDIIKSMIKTKKLASNLAEKAPPLSIIKSHDIVDSKNEVREHIVESDNNIDHKIDIRHDVLKQVLIDVKDILFKGGEITVSTLCSDFNISIEEAKFVVDTLMEMKVIGDHTDTLALELAKDEYEDEYEDELIESAIQLICDKEKASISMFQRAFRIGYNRAAKLMEKLEEMRIVGPDEFTKPRKVLINLSDKTKIIESLFCEEKQITEEISIDVNEIYKVNPNYCKEYKDVNINLIKNIFVERIDETAYEELINTFIINSNPQKMKAIIINIGYLKLSKIFNGYSQLLVPVVTDIGKTIGALNWAISEMLSRYKMFEENNVKDINSYNELGKETFAIMIITIDDYSIIKEDNTSLNAINKIIQKIFMNGEKVGIYLVIGSKYNIEDTGIGNIAKYIKVINNRELNNILSIENEIGSNISVSENNLLEIIDNMSGLEFENYSKHILIHNRFIDVRVTKSSGDQGADIIAYKDGVKYAIQCKKYSQAVGNSSVQEVIASKSMYDCHVAVVITNNYFTKGARELAEKNNVLLWDRDKLQEMIEGFTGSGIY